MNISIESACGFDFSPFSVPDIYTTLSTMCLSFLSKPFPHVSYAIEIKNICSKIKHSGEYLTFIIKACY